MRHVNEGTAAGPDDGLHQGEQALALPRIQSQAGFIQDQHVRLMPQRVPISPQ